MMTCAFVCVCVCVLEIHVGQNRCLSSSPNNPNPKPMLLLLITALKHRGISMLAYSSLSLPPSNLQTTLPSPSLSATKTGALPSLCLNPHVPNPEITFQIPKPPSHDPRNIRGIRVRW